MFRYLSVVVGLLILLLNFHGNSAAQDDPIVAKIGDKNILVSDIDRIVSYADPEQQKALKSSPQLKETLVGQYVQSMVIAQIAREKGFDKKPEVMEQMAIFIDNFLANEYIKKQFVQNITVSEGDITSYYDSRQEEFKTPEMVKVSHILFRFDAAAADAEKKKLREKAEATLKKIKAGEDFGKLASDLSDDAGSKTKGGDLGFISKGKTVKPFEDVAFSLKPGDVSGVVETQFGYHILKVAEKKESSMQSFESVRERISQMLMQERVKSDVMSFIEKAMKEKNVVIYPEVLGMKTK